MRVYPIVALMTLLGMPAMAQTLTNVGVDSVNSGIGEETLAPAVLPAQKPRNPVVPAAASATEVVAAANPLEVKGVVVTLSDTTGFDRDAALEIAAKQALPQMLEKLGHTADSAGKKVKSTGSAMQFVQGYKVVKESLIPVYTLTADLTFNGPMVIKNFGGKMPAKEAVSGVVLKVSGTEVDSVALEVEAAVAPVRQWVVKIRDRNPANVDKVRVNLNRQPATKATYRLLTSEGAELLVVSGLDSDGLRRASGGNVEVLELRIDVPVTVVPAGSGSPWQGQAEPGVPNAPAAPNAPSAPAAPEGTY